MSDILANKIISQSKRQRAASVMIKIQTEKCHTCGKTVYAQERIKADGLIFHKFGCFKCEHCKKGLKLGDYASLAGKYYCKPHFKQLFMSTGNYSSGFGDDTPKEAWKRNRVRRSTLTGVNSNELLDIARGVELADKSINQSPTKSLSEAKKTTPPRKRINKRRSSIPDFIPSFNSKVNETLDQIPKDIKDNTINKIPSSSDSIPEMKEPRIELSKSEPDISQMISKIETGGISVGECAKKESTKKEILSSHVIKEITKKNPIKIMKCLICNKIALPAVSWIADNGVVHQTCANSIEN